MKIKSIVVLLLSSSCMLTTSAYAGRHAPVRLHHRTAVFKHVVKAPDVVKDHADERKPPSFQSIDAQYRGG